MIKQIPSVPTMHKQSKLLLLQQKNLTFVKFFVVYSLLLREKLIEDGTCFNGNAFELTELPQ